MRKLLIIDDNKEILELTQYILQKKQYEVYTAFDAKLVIEIARLQRPEIILLDVVLDGERGSELCTKIKTLLPKSRLILFTALNENEVEEFKHCTDAYIFKPFDVNYFLGIIAEQSLFLDA